MIKIIKQIVFCTLLTFVNVKADTLSYFEIGKKNFKEKKFDKAKLNFERDIVRNTKNINSYLYLAKIYQIKKNYSEYVKNINTILLLDPKNEEALYLLIEKKINDGDFDNANMKINLLKKVCRDFCKKINDLEKSKKIPNH